MTILKSRYFGVLVAIVALALTLVAWVDWSSDSEFSLKADHSAVSVTTGSQAVLAVKIGSRSTSAKPVSFSFGHVPAGVTASVVSDPLSPDTAVMAFTAGSAVKAGSYPVTVTGTSGSTKRTLSVNVSVGHTPPPFTLVVRPASRTVVSRANTYYSLVYRPGLPVRAADFTVTGLPANSTHSFTPIGTWPHQDAYRLNVGTTIDVAPGTYPFTVHVTAGSDQADASGYLIVVNAVVQNFTISGDGAKQLAPGISTPINVAINNTFKRDLNFVGLNVSLDSTSNPACDTSNFVVTQYSGPSTLVIPAHTKRSLVALGVPRSQWPSVTMLNLPTNQDDCKGVTVNLTYTGAGSGT